MNKTWTSTDVFFKEYFGKVNFPDIFILIHPHAGLQGISTLPADSSTWISKLRAKVVIPVAWAAFPTTLLRSSLVSMNVFCYASLRTARPFSMTRLTLSVNERLAGNCQDSGLPHHL